MFVLPLCHVQVTSQQAGEKDDILLLWLKSVDVNKFEIAAMSTSELTEIIFKLLDFSFLKRKEKDGLKKMLLWSLF